MRLTSAVAVAVASADAAPAAALLSAFVKDPSPAP